MSSSDFGGTRLEILRYANRDELRTSAPDIYSRVRETVFFESDPRMAPMMAKFPGTVVRGDVALSHPGDWLRSTFQRIYEPLERIGKWLIFEGSLQLENNIYLDDGSPRVVILGGLDAVGIDNNCGELHVEGPTRVSGAMHFASDDGGFTTLTLAEPVGLIATSANVFSIDLDAKYFFDPLFECGFAADPENRHEEIIQIARPTRTRPKVSSRRCPSAQLLRRRWGPVAQSFS